MIPGLAFDILFIFWPEKMQQNALFPAFFNATT